MPRLKGQREKKRQLQRDLCRGRVENRESSCENKRQDSKEKTRTPVQSEKIPATSQRLNDNLKVAMIKKLKLTLEIE